MGVTLTDAQWAGAKKAGQWFSDAESSMQDWLPGDPVPQFCFTGFAGSGKSSTVGQMIEHIGLKPEEVLYMAPTGKAAKVLSRKLMESGWPTGATTIHKAIYMPRRAKADMIDRDIDRLHAHVLYIKSNGDMGQPAPDPDMASLDIKQAEARIADLMIQLSEAMDREGPNFDLKSVEDIPPEVRLFVIDEASMVNEEIVNDLSMFGRPLLGIGDPGQLPPVKGKWGFAMDDPDVFLADIHRQAADNPILYIAKKAREGEIIRPGTYGDTVRVIKTKDDDVTYDVSNDAMVLVGTNRRRWKVTKGIRKALGYTETGPMADEPLLVCKNSRKIPGLVNGTLLWNNTDHGDLVSKRSNIRLSVTDEDAGGIKYDLWAVQGIFEEHHMRDRGAHTAADREHYRSVVANEHIDWGHAITVHKSQGSEFDEVVLHDESGVFRGDSERWLYTGVTRAAERLTIVV